MSRRSAARLGLCALVLCALVLMGPVAAGDAAAAGAGSSAAAAPDAAAARVGSSAVMDDTRRAADWQIAHLASTAGRGWQQGVLLGGILALDAVSPDRTYRRAARRMSAANDWRLDGRVYFADGHCVGQSYAELFELYHRTAMITPTRSRFRRILAHPSAGSLDFTSPQARDRWSWCDALCMAPPAWARVYRLTGALRYRDFLVRNWWRTSRFLYDAEEHLYVRDSRFVSAREVNGEKVFWARGNGWVLAGIVRVLQYLPRHDPARPRFVRQFAEMCARVLECQQADGLWRASLLDPSGYPTPETSSSALFCYAFAWGVDHGLLDRSRYDPAIEAAWSGLSACLTEEGRLTHVQPPGTSPAAFDAENSEKYGAGALLLAGSETYRWALERELDDWTVRYSNGSDRRRSGVLFGVRLADVESALPGAGPECVRVMDAATSRFLPSRVADSRLVFRVSALPHESRSYVLFAAPAAGAGRSGPGR